MIANRDSIETEERCPSERDMQVYGAVRVDGRRQVDVAAEFGITQGRVSQIVRRVHRWRVGMGVAAELERRDRRSVEQWLEQLRIDKLYEETMELYRRSKEPRRKERRGKDHRGEWNSETLDHQPGNLQCLKFAGRLIELRRQLDADPPPPDQSEGSPRSRIDEYEAFRLLVDIRNDAIRRGDVPEGDSSECVVRRLMNELVGSACRAEPERASDVERLRESSEGSSRQEEPAKPAIINDISPAAAAEEAASGDTTDFSEATCDADAGCPEPAAEANNREIFSAESACRAEAWPEHPLTDEWGGERLAHASGA